MNSKKRNRVLSYIIVISSFVLSPFFYFISSFFLWRCACKYLYILCFAIVCGIAAFYYVPEADMDLNSYYNIYNSETSLFDYYGGKSDEFSKADFVIIGIFQLGHYFNMPCQSVAFFAGFIYFGCIMLIASNWFLYTSTKWNGLFLILLLILSEYLLGFTGIRFDNSVLLFILSIQYYIKNRFKTALLLSILAIVFHFSMMPVVVIWWLSTSCSFKWINFFSLGFLIIAFFFIPIMSFLQNVLVHWGPVGAGLSLAINSYVFPDDGDIGVLYAGSRFWPIQRILSFIFLLCLILSSFKFSLIRRSLISLKIYQFLIIFLSFLVFSSNNLQLFMRLLLICSYLSILLVFYFLKKNPIYKFQLFIVAYMFIYLSLGVSATFSGGEWIDLFLNDNFLTFSILL